MKSIKYLLYNLKAFKPKTKVAGIICLDCGWLGVSYSVHDFKTCPCPNNALIDGGRDYTRYGAHKMDRIQVVQVCVPKYEGMLGA